MAFIGNTNTTQAFTPAVDFFSGNASTTAFTLSRPVASVAQVQAVVNNVAQNPSDAFTVSGNTITFTSAPSSGTNNIYVYYTSPITQVIAPSQGTVGTTQLQNGLTVNFADGSAAAPSITNDGDTNTGIFFPAADTIAFAEGGAEAMRIDSSGNVGIGQSSITQAFSNYTQLNISGSSGATIQMQSGATSRANIVSDSNALYIAGLSGAIAFGVNGTGTGTEVGRFTSTGLFQFNSGYGSVATAYGCRAWVNFNGTGTVAIRASGNVTSITDNGVGDYTVNFTTAMPDVNYSIIGSSGSGNTFGSYCFNNPGAGARFAVGSCRINSFISQTAGLADVDTVCVAIFR
jgi:hypothetical protein